MMTDDRRETFERTYPCMVCKERRKYNQTGWHFVRGLEERKQRGSRVPADVQLSRVTNSGAHICAHLSIWRLMSMANPGEITKPVKLKKAGNLSGIWGFATIKMTVSSD